MTEQESLIKLLKKKGTGPTMSKSLNDDELNLLSSLFSSSNTNLTTKATMLTALLLLDKTPAETKWIENSSNIPEELKKLVSPSHDYLITLVQKCIQKTDLTEQDSQKGFELLFDSNTEEHWKAAFLEGLRLKRESTIENQTCYDTLYKKSTHIKINTPLLIDISNAYDGFNRNHFLGPFVAALLGAAGYPTLLHGVDSTVPKNGVNTHKILKEAKKNPLKKLTDTQSDLENKDIAWAYVDQQLSAPDIYSLKSLRTNMVKRPILATIEKLLLPIQSKTANYIVTGYTHPPYKEKLCELLKGKNFLIVRGVEGSTQLAMDRRTPWILPSTNGFVSPTDFGFDQLDKIEPNHDLTVSDSLKAGLSGLQGKSPLMANQIIYSAAVILTQFELLSTDATVAKLKSLISDGSAYRHWLAGA